MLLGEILVAAKVCDASAVERGLVHASSTGQRLGSALIELGVVDSDTIAAALAKQHGIAPAKETSFATIDADVLSLVAARVAKKHAAIPLGVHRDTGDLVLAMRDPADKEGLESLQLATGMRVRPAAASARRILRALAELYERNNSAPEAPVDLELDLATPPPLETPQSASFSPDTSEGSGEAPTTETPTSPPSELPKAQVVFDLRAFLGTAPGIAVIALSLAVLLFVGKWAYNWITDKEIPAKGNFTIDHVGLRADFPATGWLYAPAADDSQSVSLVEVRVAVLYRGQSLDHPDDLLGLMRIRAPFGRTASTTEFRQLIDSLNASPSSSMSAGEFRVRSHQCSLSARRTEPTAECVGGADYRGTDYEFTAFLWFARDNSVIAALFLTKGEFISFDGEIDTIVDSLDIDD